jgi:hypothetical protein
MRFFCLGEVVWFILLPVVQQLDSGNNEQKWHNFPPNKKGAIANPLIFQVELRGIEPLTS